MSDWARRLDHPQRRSLSAEVHARPPVAITPPMAVSYLAHMADPNAPGRATSLLSRLLSHFDVDATDASAKHHEADLGEVRLRWERHTEFARYSFIAPPADAPPFEQPPIRFIPAEWLDELRGTVMVGLHARIEQESELALPIDELSRRHFGGHALAGSQIGDGAALALTDFRIHDDGFNRLLVLNDAMPPQQLGRMIQRLLEIDTYRVMALLALPMAMSMGPRLQAMEKELVSIGEALTGEDQQNEQRLLERLTEFGAQSETRRLESRYRFAAADAYYDLVLQRISELREVRIRGMQTYEEFIKRRLAPAIKTCRSTEARQRALSEGMARTTSLLSTRIDVQRQLQNQRLLASMNQRAKHQLRLQATVEGLSVAAVTYYVVGLVGYLGEGLVSLGWPVDPDLLMAASIPLVALTVFGLVRKVRRSVAREAES